MVKIIHQIFLNIGLKPLEDRRDYLNNINIIKELNPDWEHKLWKDDTLDEFVNENYPENLKYWNNFPYPMYKIDILIMVVVLNIFVLITCYSQIVEKKKSLPSTWKCRLFQHSVSQVCFTRFSKLKKITSDLDYLDYFKTDATETCSWLYSIKNQD